MYWSECCVSAVHASPFVNTKKQKCLWAPPYVVFTLQRPTDGPKQCSLSEMLSRSTSKLRLQLYLCLNHLQLKLLTLNIFSCLCSQVAGIKGVFLSNKVVENEVKTFITYNKGRDWRLLHAPTTDLSGTRLYCVQVSLHLQVSNI